MRLSLLALGALSGAPSMSWGFHMNTEALLGGEGDLGVETMETIGLASPLLAPSDQANSFIGLNAARQGLPHLRTAQNAARQAIVQRLGEKGGAVAEQMMQRIGMKPARASVQQPLQPHSSIVRPPPVTPGAAAPAHPAAPLSHASAPAAPATPAARLLMKRHAHPPVQAKPHMGIGAAKSPLHNLPPRGTILKRHASTLAVGADETPPKKELSEDELTAANKEMAKNEPELKKQIVQVMHDNLEDFKKHHSEETTATGGGPVAQLAIEALNRMTGGRPGTKEAILRNVSEATTGKVVAPECLVKQIRVLGVGGLGAVIEAEVIDETCRKALKMDKVAVKLLYENVSGIDLSRVDPNALANSSESMIKPELEPLKLIQAAVNNGQSAQDLMKKSRWALPAFSASAGNVEEVYIHNGILLSRRVLISEIMLGDGMMLLHMHNGSPGARLPMPAREYVCSQLLTSVASLHEVGLVHYDIKPENILLGLDGTIHLADFGMCGKADQPKSCTEGLTFLYADSAQADCFQRKGMLTTNQRYDTWSTGVTCYLLMTGTGFPYKITNNNTVLQHLSSLSWRSILRPSTGIGDPEKELLDAGASHMWARIVGEMLTILRDERPTPMDLVKKYHIGGSGHD